MKINESFKGLFTKIFGKPESVPASAAKDARSLTPEQKDMLEQMGVTVGQYERNVEHPDVSLVSYYQTKYHELNNLQLEYYQPSLS